MSGSNESNAGGLLRRGLEQGRARLRAGDHRAALAIAERLLAESGESPETLLFAGEVHFARGNFARAGMLARRCGELFPDDPSGGVLLCRALLAMGRIGEARDIAFALSQRDIRQEAHFEILVTVLTGCMEPEAAWRLCRKSLELDPANPAGHRRLALTGRMLGRLDEAVAAANVAIRHDPHDYEMIGLRSTLHRATPADNHVAALEALLAAGCRNSLGAARVAYALAREHEDLGQDARAFHYLEAGARFRRESLRCDIAAEEHTHRLIAEHHDAERLNDGREGFATGEPIFVLGLPRTGSTLVERILASHSAVHAAGELLHLSAAMMEEVRRLGPPADQADLLRKSLEADPAAIGRNYLDRTRPFTGHTPHFVDKRPLNYLSIGIIHRALPGAKIVHVRRAPLDTCYAIYKFLFNDAYPWSYDLGDIARYYVAYRRLMDHWQAALPGRLIEVTYENVVADLEGEARRLLAALNLDWEPACARFHESATPAYTGSAAQVRQPVYASSVDRWRRHEERLAGVRRILEEAGIDPLRP